MFKFVTVFAACLAYAAAGLVQPTAFAAAPVAVGYANAHLYAAGGSQQIDVRNNFDGTLSSYTTTPFGYTSPISSRYVAGAPAAAYAAPVNFAAPAPTAFAAPAPQAFAAPAAYPYAVASPFAAQYAAPAGYAAPAFAAAAPAKVVV